jgi:hypothetical protein
MYVAGADRLVGGLQQVLGGLLRRVLRGRRRDHCRRCQKQVLFGIGLVFSLIAMTDGLLFTDPYFGYGSLERRCIESRSQYTDRKAELIDTLRKIRDAASEAMNAAAHDLTVRRGEFDSILQARTRLAQRFTEHQNHIERSGRALLAIYREANRKTRTCPAPGYFSKPFNLDRIIYLGNEPNELARDQLRQSIIDSQDVLKSQAIHWAISQSSRLPGGRAILMSPFFRRCRRQAPTRREDAHKALGRHARSPVFNHRARTNCTLAPAKRAIIASRGIATVAQTGFYFGGDVGGAFSSSNATWDPPSYSCYTVSSVCADAVGFGPGAASGGTGGSAFAGGLLAGYNVQIANSWVAGIEGDWTGMRVGGSFTQPWVGPLTTGGTTTLSSELEWALSLRGRPRRRGAAGGAGARQQSFQRR